MKVTIKPLVTYCNSISNRIKERKHWFPHSSIFPQGVAPVQSQVDQYRCGVLTEPRTKCFWRLSETVGWERGSGEARIRKALSSKSERRRISSRFLLSSLDKGLRKASAQARNVEMRKGVAQQGGLSLWLQPLSETAMNWLCTNLVCGGQLFPVRPAR